MKKKSINKQRLSKENPLTPPLYRSELATERAKVCADLSFFQLSLYRRIATLQAWKQERSLKEGDGNEKIASRFTWIAVHMEGSH